MMGKITSIAAEKGSMRDQDDGCIPLSDGVIELTGIYTSVLSFFIVHSLPGRMLLPAFPQHGLFVIDLSQRPVTRC
jgi:hypothetical protein